MIENKLEEKLIEKILSEDKKLEKKYHTKLEKNFDLNRSLVSFQSNKQEPQYRWYKFKEGFSSSLVKYFIEKYGIKSGNLLDPFAGSGAALFVGLEANLDVTGVELLPIGSEIIKVRELLRKSDIGHLVQVLEDAIIKKPWVKSKKTETVSHLNITKGAFPEETEELLLKYLSYAKKAEEPVVKQLLRFAAICILEEISFTRKDGQYLRWDFRSGRKQGAKLFNKGKIKTFDEAIISKLEQIKNDLVILNVDSSAGFKMNNKDRELELLEGSCLDILPTLKSKKYDFIMTSPPYCNRYDYTRTYALELMLSGIGEEKIRDLRQSMLSCTVENKEKIGLDKKFGSKIYNIATDAFDNQKLLQYILQYLNVLKDKKELNNPGIARMVKNYFYELSLIIAECARTMKKNGYFVMVNDNVRYAGISIPVDLILSDFAEAAGLEVEKIWILPIGKGNSSQQMGNHGRKELRKCVYVWKKL